MPLYELRDNAENRIKLDNALIKEVRAGRAESISGILSSLGDKKTALVVIDGWYGIDWDSLAEAFTERAAKENNTIEIIRSAVFFQTEDQILHYSEKFMTDDPSFGFVNNKGVLADIIDSEKVEMLCVEMEESKDRQSAGIIKVIMGPGAYQECFDPYIDCLVYADFTMQPMLWQMWSGELAPFGRTEPDPDYFWKRYYYNDFYLLLKQKKAVFEKMDFYLEMVDSGNPKLLPKKTYESMIDDLVKRPFKQVKITQPGPWGAYRYKDLWDIPGLECNAWNELAGIELSVLIDLGDEKTINIPAQNFMQRPEEVVGKWVHENYPDLMPLQVWLDDGYFPEPVPYERSSMPIHNHPDTAYVNRNFNEPLGRYENILHRRSLPGSVDLDGL